jgi:hypothetical protein
MNNMDTILDFVIKSYMPNKFVQDRVKICVFNEDKSQIISAFELTDKIFTNVFAIFSDILNTQLVKL